MNKTKIVATIGPNSEDIKTLKSLFKAGVNICRQNFSHGDFKEHAQIFNNIKKAARELAKDVATLQDLAGPKIRTGENEALEFLNIKKGATVLLTNKKCKNTEEKIFIDYKKLIEEVKVGERVLLNDGKLSLKVISKVDKNTLKAKVLIGGKIRSRRGVNLPDSDISVSSLTAKDKKDLDFALKNLDFDFVALSFVRSARDIKDLRKILNKHNSQIQIVAKIETPQAVENIDEILQETDAIMVARGDLAIEIGAENVPMVQKKLIKKANALGKPVVVATQMLESMINSATATRAEVSDISNAILDGADAVMLSEETAMGAYAKEAVETMRKVANKTEEEINYEKRVKREYAYTGGSISKTDASTRYAAKTALDLDAKAIVVFTETGTTAKMLSRFRTKQDIFVISPSEKVLRQTQILFGVYPGKQANLSYKRDVIEMSKKMLLEKKIVKKGDLFVVVSGSIFGKPGETNTITIVEI